ncbi:hypothetical protein KL942_003193 [Ogataea angusta]|uniref:Uncharacterized protein n=1 Tax=Pichia angusta TaxID=870730 RepID=A0ABQ7RVU6_PICAN|nr:hypothetical protein KL942_003193 [Ogataea angusta]KAG7849215.1 hypothetical protein KL940_002897 [Ogataea angusta]
MADPPCERRPGTAGNAGRRLVAESGVAVLGVCQRVGQVAFGTGHGREDSSIGPPGQQKPEHRAEQHVDKVVAVVLCARHSHVEGIQRGQHRHDGPPCPHLGSGSLQLAQEPERGVAQGRKAHAGVARRRGAEAVQELFPVFGGADLLCVVERILDCFRVWLASVEEVGPTPANPVFEHVCDKDARSKSNKVS